MMTQRAAEVVGDLFKELQNVRPLGAEQFSSLLSAGQYRHAYDVVLRRVSKSTRVLDWGCVRGHFSYFLSRFGYDVTAYSLEAGQKWGRSSLKRHGKSSLLPGGIGSDRR
jgi:Tellurite resistance protein TehB